MDLSEKQCRIITDDTSKNIVVVAGAGSGKTRVLTERVKYLLDMGVRPSSIVCITYTRLAAQEMMDRLSAVPEIGDVFIGTIHALAHKIYRTSGSKFTILSDKITVQIMQFIFGEMHNAGKISKLTFKKWLAMQDVIEQYHMGYVDKSDIINFLTPSEKYDLSIVTKRLVEKCKQRNVITFDMLLEKAQEYYAQVNNNIEYLLVDEFQDVSSHEARFIFDLMADHYFIVGDDWQAIYGFKGANYKIFKRLVDNETYTTYTLNTNYRCSAEIIEFSQAIIRRVPDTIPKEVINYKGKNGIPVTVDSCRHLAQYIKQIDKEKNYKDWFILARTNRQIAEIEDLLKAYGTSYRCFRKSQLTLQDLKNLQYENTIKLLTVHTSKGLEAKNVILFGHFPVNVPKYRLKPEERKIMYVGCTRAQDRLIVLN